MVEPIMKKVKGDGVEINLAVREGAGKPILCIHGITANCLVPGDVDTVRGTSAGPAAHHAGGGSNLLGRDGRPEEIAAMVAMLCRPESAYTTGQTIHVNGGGYLP